MASEQRSITGSVSVESDAKPRVAFDLMKLIGYHCHNVDMGPQQKRKYWLELYHQCLRAADGDSAEQILKDE